MEPSSGILFFALFGRFWEAFLVVVALIAAAFDAVVFAVPRTIVAEITGDQDGACYINDHMYLQEADESII